MIERELTFAELASVLDMSLDEPESYELTGLGLQVESMEDSNITFKDIESFLVKPSVDVHYKLGDLLGTANHRVLYNNEYVFLKDHPDSIKIDGPLKVVDIEVADTNCYIANGQVNHNTTSGGLV